MFNEVIEVLKRSERTLLIDAAGLLSMALILVLALNVAPMI